MKKILLLFVVLVLLVALFASCESVPETIDSESVSTEETAASTDEETTTQKKPFVPSGPSTAETDDSGETPTEPAEDEVTTTAAPQEPKPSHGGSGVEMPEIKI